jgi:hypothetical protein
MLSEEQVKKYAEGFQKAVERMTRKAITSPEGADLEKILFNPETTYGTRNNKLVEQFKKLSLSDMERVFAEVVNLRPDDKKFDNLAMKEVHGIAQVIAKEKDLNISSSEKDKLSFITGVYRVELTGVKTGIYQVEDGKEKFDGKTLNISKKIVVPMIFDKILGKEFGDIMRRKGDVGKILDAADQFVGMTSKWNPAKLTPGARGKKIYIDGELKSIEKIDFVDKKML